MVPRDGIEPKATGLAITGLRYLVASFMPPKMPPKRKVPLGVCVLSPTMPKHYREGRECYAEGVTGAIPRNANFGDAGKRLPPSFGSAAAPDFLPSPPRQRGVVVVLQSRFRCRIRREASSLQGLYKLGRRKWKQRPTLKSSYEAKGRGSNYPQRGWAWGEPKRWGRLRIAIQRSSGASISDSAKLAGSSDVQRRCPSQEERRKPG